MSKKLRVLNVEDSPNDAALLNLHLTRVGYDVQSLRVDTADALRSALASGDWDVILCDYSLPEFDALSAVGVVREIDPEIPMIVVSGTVDEHSGVAAMNAGATDYFRKDDLARLGPTIDREVQKSENRKNTEAALEQSEMQLRQAQKMEAIGRLAGGIAHDFNNLLTVISGYTELMLKGLEEEDPLRRNCLEIKKAGDRAAVLTRQLLAFSRRQVMQPKVLDLNTVVSEMESMLERLLGEDIELCTALHPDSGHVKADPGQIEQVIMNLAVNARDAMPRGGQLIIETGNVRFDKSSGEPRPGSYVLIGISDTGVGMDAETQSMIFDPFFTTKPVGQGTGLGLSTVYGIVDQSGGFIKVDSRAGAGTTFRIYLPRLDEESLDWASRYACEETLRGSETVLIAEDEDVVRDLAREVLESYGYNVLAARNGEEALAVCEDHAGVIDLLISDVVMPGIGGRELRDSLLLDHRGMKVLFMSGYTDDAIVRYGVLESKLPFIQKPFTPEKFAIKVREVLDEKQAA